MLSDSLPCVIIIPYHGNSLDLDIRERLPTRMNDPIASLREEFRGHLEHFYARLKLAPPYHSVEKALQQLAASLKALPQSEQARIAADPGLRWQQFADAFATSGLSKKHRGIITGLAGNRSAIDLPAEYDHFLRLFGA